MLENGLIPNIVTCTNLLDTFSKEGLVGEAILFLDRTHQSLGIVPNLCMYRVIINESTGVWKIFADMIKRGYILDVVLYSIIIDGFVKALKLQEALRFYHNMLHEGIKPNIFTYTSLINGLCRDDRLPEAMELMSDMIEEELVLDKV
jgi:pentatricopeptide repeat protein